jgi:hypothetical protein
MKKTTLLLPLLLLTGLGGLMAWTNPNQTAFEEFAVEQVKTELCPKVPLGFAKQCPDAIAQNQDFFKTFIGKGTKAQNFGLFSLYESNISVRDLLPEDVMNNSLASLIPLPPPYHLKTVGLCGRFFIYNAEAQK